MQLTKGAIGNLINRYKAVLKKCHLMNTFGSLAVAGMLVMGGAGVAVAEGSWTKPNGETAQWTNGVVPNGTVLQGTYKGFSQAEGTLAGVATVDYTTTGVSVANETTFTSNSKTAGAAGALKLLNGIKIGDNVTFTDNTAINSAWGGGAIYIKLTKEATSSEKQQVSIGSKAKFANNQAQTWGGAIALEYGELTIAEGATFEGNKTLGANGSGEEGGGAIAVWHDSSNGEPGQTRLSVTKATFKQNSTHVSGGAIYNKDGNITITGSQFDQNSSGSMGGAIANMSGETDYTGEINITDSGFTGNTAGNGGAVWNGADGKVNITNSTFSKNTAMLEGHILQQGGAITNGGEMTVNDGSFDGNNAGKGGAIYNATNATLKITGTSFTNNTAAGWGGAILNSGATITVTDARFENNIAQHGTGGAIGNPNEGTPSVTVSGTKFLNNHAFFDGGAIGNYGGMKIENCLFEGNTAQLDFDGGTWTKPVTDDTPVGGGAISLGAVSNSAIASISGTTFKNNTSGTNGGAIATRQAAHADNSAAKLDIAATFIGNKAQQGGAIYNSFYTDNGLGKGAGVTVTGTFSGNEATSKGGAIYNDGTLDKNSTPSGGVMTITDATFDGNKANYGGAIFNTGKMTVNGGDFEGNTAAKAAGAIYNAAGATLTVDGVTFANNSSAKAGAINSMAGKNEGTTTTIKNSKFNNNSAVNGMGGALANSSNAENGSTEGFSGKMSLTDTAFSGNTARNGGALWNGAQWTVDITGGSFDNNSAVTPADSTLSAQGGAISNSGALNISGVTFSNNKTDGLGGAIYNTKTGGGAGSITFNGTNTFTNNTAAGKANDIYNDGTITVAGGTTTLNSGLILAENGTVEVVTGGTLDMASGSTLDMGNGILTINGGTFVADAGLLIKSDTTTGSYAVNDANKVTDSNIVGTQGNLNLRWFDGDYTLAEYTSVKDALLTPSDEKAELTLLNATLKVERDQVLVTGATTPTDGTAKLDTGAKVVNSGTSVADSDPNVPHTPENYVSVVNSSNASTLLKVSTIVTDGNSITAKGLKVDGLPEGSKEVTLQVTSSGVNNSTLTLVGDSKADTGVIDKDGKALATKADVKAHNTLNMGLTGNTRDQGLTLTGATVSGTLNANGGVAGTTSEYAIDSLKMETDSQVNVLNSTMQIGEFQANGGTMFVDPAYVKIGSVAGEFGTQLLVSSGSTVNIGGMPEADMRQAMEKAGMSVGPNFTVGANQSVLVLGQGITLGATGKIVVDANVTPDGKVNGTDVAQAHFGKDSLLVVNGTNINGTAALDLGTASTPFTVRNGAKLLISGAQNGKTYTVIANGNGSNAFNGSGYSNSAADGWKGSNLLTSSDMVTLTSADGMTFTAGVEDAKNVFPNLSEGMTNAVNKLYRDSLNNVDSDQMGVRFLSRATDNRFLGADKNAAAESIESAARIAFAGAVPQMTKMASDAGTNAVVNRLGFADPADGAQAMDADGKIVDRNTTGFALWIAPLWQSQHGWGMDADSMDYGFNGNLGGVSLGADYTFENAIRAGITFNIGGGYAESSGGDLSSTENRMNFWGLGAYAGWNYENFGVMADVSYTSTWNQLKQDVDSRMGMGDLEADVQATAISAGLRAEYLLQTSAMDIIPHIGVRYMSLNTWGYDVDTHGGTVLEGDSLHQDIWTFPIGVTFSKDFALDSGWSFKPSLDFTVIPAAGDIKAKHDVHFTGLPGTYEVETQMMNYLTWQGGVGLELANDNMSIGVNYTLQAGQHTTGHGVFGSFRYEF